MTREYPPDFGDWTPEARDAFFGEKARDYREKAGSGVPAEIPTRRPFGTSDGEGFPGGESEPNWTMALTCASSIKPEPIRWLWRNWLARGKMHIVAGQPGVGKIMLAMKVAATVSAGGRWPDGGVAEKGNVVIWSGEDDPADTLVPRLEASGADLSRIFFAGELTCGKERRPFDPAKDIPALQAAIAAAGGASLIVVDPIVSATSADSHKNSETRRGLQPLVDMATELDAALLGITHFTKGSEGRSPIDRVTGSVAFGALARVVMVAARQQGDDDGNPSQRMLMRAKSNIGPDEGGFEYDLQLVPMRANPDIVASVIVWGNAIDGTARDVLAIAESTNDDAGSAFSEAKDFLLDFLAEGQKPAKEVKAAALRVIAGQQFGAQKMISTFHQSKAVRRGRGCCLKMLIRIQDALTPLT